MDNCKSGDLYDDARNYEHDARREDRGTFSVGESAPSRTFIEAIQYCLKNPFKLTGCASLSEFWWFALFIFSVLSISKIMLLGNLLFLWPLVLLFHIIFPILLIPVSVRRLHDAGFSGWLNLIILIPGIGLIVLIVLLCLQEKLSGNIYR